MTAADAIAWIDEKKHNVYSREDKLEWLHRLELTAKAFMEGYEDADIPEMPDSSRDMDIHRQLLIPAPFDDLYLYHLEAQMDYSTQEFNKYNNAAAMFRAQWEAFTAWFNRTHTHKTAPVRY